MPSPTQSTAAKRLSAAVQDMIKRDQIMRGQQPAGTPAVAKSGLAAAVERQIAAMQR